MSKLLQNLAILIFLSRQYDVASPFTAPVIPFNRGALVFWNDFYSNKRFHHHNRAVSLFVTAATSPRDATSSSSSSSDDNSKAAAKEHDEPVIIVTSATSINGINAVSYPKYRRLKDRLWVRETLEDLTTAEFACRVEQHTPEITTTSLEKEKPSKNKQKRKQRPVDFENILDKLEHHLDEMCVIINSGENYTSAITTNTADFGGNEDQAMSLVSRELLKKKYRLVDGKGLGSVVYTKEQREALMGKLLCAHYEIFKAMNRADGTLIESASKTLSPITISPVDLEVIRSKLQQQEYNTSSSQNDVPPILSKTAALPTPRLYIREDGTVDWEGALQDQAALKLFGTAVWARINGQDSTMVSDEGQIIDTEHDSLKKKAAVTAKILETAAIRDERVKLQAMQQQLAVVEEGHAALLASAISAGAATANINFASINPELRTKIRESTTALEMKREQVSFQKLVYDLERIYVYLDGEIGNTRGGSVPLQDRLAVAEFGLLESQIESLRRQLGAGEESGVDSDVLTVIVDQLNDFKGRLGIDYYVTGLTFDSDAIKRWVKDLWEQIQTGIAFYVKGCQLLWNDVVFCGSLIGRALQGYTLKPREVRTLRRTFKDVLTFIPFVIILIIPLTPIGHVLIFGAIQRFFPDFFPSCFTERRQNLLQLYERTEYSKVVIDETLQEKLSRLAEAGLFVVVEASRRLWKAAITTGGDLQSKSDDSSSNNKNS